MQISKTLSLMIRPDFRKSLIRSPPEWHTLILCQVIEPLGDGALHSVKKNGESVHSVAPGYTQPPR